MADRNKVETKRVYEILNGEKKLKEIVEEMEPLPKNDFDKKDYVDLVFKIFGVVALALPLYLYFLQTRSEIEKERSLYELDLITNTTAELHTLINRDSINEGFKKSYNKAFYELKPKMRLLKDSTVSELFEEIKIIQDGIIKLYSVNVVLDTIYKQTTQFAWEKFKSPKKFEANSLLDAFIIISQSSLLLEMQKSYEKIDEYQHYIENLSDTGNSA